MNYLNELERFSVILFSLFFVFQGLFINLPLYFTGFVGYNLSEISNCFFKNYISKPLIGNKKLPILGIGSRPKGAKNCGILSDGLIAKSYGMPSGHSQAAGFFMMFQLLNTNNPLYRFLIISISIWIMYSRIKLGCHTIQQVIIGGIIGIIFGYLTNYFYKKYLSN